MDESDDGDESDSDFNDDDAGDGGGDDVSDIEKSETVASLEPTRNQEYKETADTDSRSNQESDSAETDSGNICRSNTDPTDADAAASGWHFGQWLVGMSLEKPQGMISPEECDMKVLVIKSPI